MTRTVNVDSGWKYMQKISVGPHEVTADEPVDLGGADTGPNPYELLLGALGACTSMTVRMYAERKQWPLEGVHVELSYGRVHVEDCEGCDNDEGSVDGIKMEVSFAGDLTNEQLQRLVEIANKCPVHRTLNSRVPIDVQLRELSAV